MTLSIPTSSTSRPTPFSSPETNALTHAKSPTSISPPLDLLDPAGHTTSGHRSSPRRPPQPLRPSSLLSPTYRTLLSPKIPNPPAAGRPHPQRCDPLLRPAGATPLQAQPRASSPPAPRHCRHSPTAVSPPHHPARRRPRRPRLVGPRSERSSRTRGTSHGKLGHGGLARMVNAVVDLPPAPSAGDLVESRRHAASRAGVLGRGEHGRDPCIFLHPPPLPSVYIQTCISFSLVVSSRAIREVLMRLVQRHDLQIWLATMSTVCTICKFG